MASENIREGHAPRSGQWRCTAEAGPGQLTLWINGEDCGGASNPEGPVNLYSEVWLQKGDSIKFEAIPGPLIKSNSELLRQS